MPGRTAPRDDGQRHIMTMTFESLVARLATALAEDDTAPSTTLSADYPEPDAAEFSFSADEDASFACSLDGTSFVPCGVSRVYSDLAPGWHTFAVRATDRAGNTDPSPAEARWHAKNSHAGDTGGG